MSPVWEFEKRAPSNIAFIKYWGKKNGKQRPINSSLSMTLKNAETKMKLQAFKDQRFAFDFLFEGERKPDFQKRIEIYFEKIASLYPILREFSYRIESSNSFPHSAGIASSASSYAALAKCLSSFLKELKVKELPHESYLARLGSGSACRSCFSPFSIWEEEDFEQAKSFPRGQMPPLGDTIVLIDKKRKKVSSSMGHSFMDSHHYKEARIKRANLHLKKMKESFQRGDFKSLGELMEKEALELHALMMTSEDPFILFSSQTLEIIHWVKKMREKLNFPFYFTLDAGPNIHLISLKRDQKKLQSILLTDFPSLEIILDEQGDEV